MKAVVMVQLLEDDADTNAVQEALLDAAALACPNEQDEDSECWCVIGYSHTLDLGDDETVDWVVVPFEDD